MYPNREELMLLHVDEEKVLLAKANSTVVAMYRKEKQRADDAECERKELTNELENEIGGMPSEGNATNAQIIAAVKLVKDQRDYAIETIEGWQAKAEQLQAQLDAAMRVVEAVGLASTTIRDLWKEMDVEGRQVDAANLYALIIELDNNAVLKTARKAG